MEAKFLYPEYLYQPGRSRSRSAQNQRRWTYQSKYQSTQGKNHQEKTTLIFFTLLKIVVLYLPGDYYLVDPPGEENKKHGQHIYSLNGISGYAIDTCLHIMIFQCSEMINAQPPPLLTNCSYGFCAPWVWVYLWRQIIIIFNDKAYCTNPLVMYSASL